MEINVAWLDKVFCVLQNTKYSRHKSFPAESRTCRWRRAAPWSSTRWTNTSPPSSPTWGNNTSRTWEDWTSQNSQQPWTEWREEKTSISSWYLKEFHDICVKFDRLWSHQEETRADKLPAESPIEAGSLSDHFLDIIAEAIHTWTHTCRSTPRKCSSTYLLQSVHAIKSKVCMMSIDVVGEFMQLLPHKSKLLLRLWVWTIIAGVNYKLFN